MMNGYGKSDSSVVPEKSPNKDWKQCAEGMEGRGLAKGNPLKCNVLRTQRRIGASSALERVRQAARKNKQQRFTVYPSTANLPPLSFGALVRHDLRQEPYEVAPHVRICAGG